MGAPGERGDAGNLNVNLKGDKGIRGYPADAGRFISTHYKSKC